MRVWVWVGGGSVGERESAVGGGKSVGQSVSQGVSVDAGESVGVSVTEGVDESVSEGVGESVINDKTTKYKNNENNKNSKIIK